MAEAALLSPGLIIADTYEIERLLGRGGMGEVWLARHRRLAGKQVAVKVLRLQGLVSAEALARFRREAEIAARLEHPNIVQVLDYNTLPTGEPFLVMELLKGESLAQRLALGPLALEAVRQVLRQVGSALQAAHRAGVVHRDLKPENIFLVPTSLGDTVKVLDFGISKLADSQTVQTTDSVLIGTPLYMSPEQALGNNREVNAQSDLFSLGSICYELLTGQPPFAADSVAKVVFRIAYEKHVPLSQARGDLPDQVVHAIEHALEKDKRRRTPDIETFVLELTGSPLATPATPSAAGVYAPGMALSESLVSGDTAHPSRQPALAAPQPRAPAADSHVSGRTLTLGLLGVVLLLALGVVATRRYWQSLPAPDAGVPLSAVAGMTPRPRAPERALDATPDASVPSSPSTTPPTASEAVDAGRHVATPAAVNEAPDTPSPRDQKVLEELSAAAQRADWEYLEAQRSRVRGLDSRTARARALSWVALAMCHRASNLLLGSTIAELRRVAPPSLVRNVKRDCQAVYPPASAFTW